MKENINMQKERNLAWEDARITTNIELSNAEMRRVEEELQAMEKILTIEKNGMEEARHTFSKCIEKLNELIQMWEKKYNCDLTEIETNILKLGNENEDLNNSYEEFQVKEENYQKLISELEERKYIREEEIKLKMFRDEMATKIQSFWRGTMVRKFLGPHKKLNKTFQNQSKKKSIKKKKIKKTK
jgi:uncharacterized protein YukE